MLKEALEDWNPWWIDGKVSKELIGRPRDILSTIEHAAIPHKIKVITGVRRSGKSTIFYQLIDKLLRKTDPKNILLLNFDDVRFSDPLEKIYKAYIELKMPDNIYLFLDEVHNAKEWVSLVRRLVDLKKAEIFITDSSSYFIPIDYTKILTGRKISFEVYPLSFKEYLNFKNIKARSFGTEEAAKIRGYLKEYIMQGGFPELFSAPKKYHRSILIEYFEDIVTKDIVSRYGVNYRRIRDFAYYLISNIGQRVTYRKLKNIFRMGIETAQRYMDFMEYIYMIFRVNMYSEKTKEQIIAPKKIYAIDTGLANAIGFRVTDNIGSMLENIIFLELKRHGYNVFYLRSNNKELDFVVKRNFNLLEAINVCYDPTDITTRKREIESIIFGLKKLGLKEGKIITWDYEETINVDNKVIMFIPAYKWLLQQSHAT